MNNRISLMMLIILLAFITNTQAQVGINEDNSQPDASALLDVKSSNKGVLIPRMTTTERTNINMPATGLLVYDNTTNSFWYYAGTAWKEVNAGILTALSDADNDTKIQVEEGSDEDMIRLDIAGTERMVLKENPNGYTMLGFPNNEDNIFIGENAGQAHNPVNLGILTIGHSNTYIGSNAGASSTIANANVYLGHHAGASNTTASGNVYIGAYAGENQQGGSNVSLGSGAGQNNVYGAHNVFLGNQSGYNSSGSRNVFIGHNAGYSETGSDKLYIDNSITNSPLIYGDFSTNFLRINGNLNINGTYTMPTNGGTNGQVLTTNGNGGASWQTLTDNDNQDLSLSNHTLSLTNDGTTVDLSSYLDNTDNQDLTLSGNTLSLTNDGTTVDLSSYLDNTDNQDLTLSGNTLSLTNDGTTVDLSSYVNTDNQDLTLSSNTLSLTNDASSVDLSSYLDSKWTNSNNDIYNINSGNIGIGTSTPKEKLEVNGSIQLGDGNNATPTAGAVRWNSTTQDFEGFMGDKWASLTYGSAINPDSVNNYSSSSEQMISKGAGTYGFSVAISGDYAIVGAITGNSQTGTAFIYKKNGTDWIEQTQLIANDAANLDNFGISVSISGDYAIVGANQGDGNATNSGSAYIFTRSGTMWTQQAKLTANDGNFGDEFGFSVSISGDAVIVGARYDDDNGSNSGSAYVFTRTGTAWSQQAKLTANDGNSGDEFGRSVSISGDDVVVGAPENAARSAYVFTRNGTVWTQQAKLTANADYFGGSVSISGNDVIVGAFQDDDNGFFAGSAYIFVRNGINWTQQAKLNSNDIASGDLFGVSVSISGDYAIIGAYGDKDNGTNSGSAYIFRRNGTTWTQHNKLTANDGSAGDWFGGAVSMSGSDVIVGAYGANKSYFYTGSTPIISSDSLYIPGKGLLPISNLMSQINSNEINVSGKAEISADEANQLTIKNEANNDNAANIYFDKTALGATQVGAIGVGNTTRDFFIAYNGVDRLNINENGLVGINRQATTNTLEVGGNASKATAGDWLANSDARLKKNITPLSSNQMLDNLLALQGVTYEWNDTVTGNNRPLGIQYGFTAQNIQEVFPTLVNEDNQGYLQTAYGTYDAMYVEAFRALNDKVEKLEQENEALKAQVNEISELKALLQALQQQVNAEKATVSKNSMFK